MPFMNNATSSNFLKNWWGYTNYFLNQKPWLKYVLVAGSMMVGAYVAWPFGLTFKAVSLFGVSSLMSHFLSYAFLGSVNLSWQLFKTFSVLKSYLDSPSPLEEANFDRLFNELFTNQNQINLEIVSQLERTIFSKFQNWASNYGGNKVPNDYEAELDSFLNEALAIEVDAYMPHVNYVFEILKLQYQNQGHAEGSPTLNQLDRLESSIKDTFRIKFLGGIFNYFKEKLKSPEYEQVFFQSALNAMIKKQLQGRDPFSILELKQHPNPTPELVGQQFRTLIIRKRADVLHGNASLVDPQFMIHARDIAIAQIQHHLKP
ncbi:MAG: hypothetical protein U1E78_10805 [Gammaproteobacteria bacterium]